MSKLIIKQLRALEATWPDHLQLIVLSGVITLIDTRILVAGKNMGLTYPQYMHWATLADFPNIKHDGGHAPHCIQTVTDKPQNV